MRSRLVLVAMLATTLLASVGSCGSSEDEAEPPVIGAAASLRRVMPALLDAFRSKHAVGPVHVSYGASGAIRNQVIAGAPMDAVILASGAPIDDLIERGLLEGDSRRVVARNTLVLIGPVGSPPLTFESLAEARDGERIAVGEPESVPAGGYAREALLALGVWDALKPRFVYAQDVSGVLAYVRRGEVAAGIVYETETRDVQGVVRLDRADGAWAPTPRVVAGVVAGAAHGDLARAFLAFATSESAQRVLREAGFESP